MCVVILWHTCSFNTTTNRKESFRVMLEKTNMFRTFIYHVRSILAKVRPTSRSDCYRTGVLGSLFISFQSFGFMFLSILLDLWIFIGFIERGVTGIFITTEDHERHYH
ncbi:hypothetical protein N665_0532s0021 [Sinapis alba]|nr:hypothetical protein N665_0532s0021 [Sinapis alba]